MQRCPRCDRAVAETDATCGGCGQALGGSVSQSGAIRAQSKKERPAHLALLEGARAEAEITASERPSSPPKPRLQSRAGPAMPVQRTDDAVPTGASGWMARLEAAKGRAPSAAETEQKPPPLPPAAVPPPLPVRSRPERPASSGSLDAGALTKKPAHLLVAELEAEAEKKRAKKAAAMGGTLDSAADEISKSEIAQHEIEKPDTEVKQRKVPRWLLPVVSVVVIGGVIGAYFLATQKTPTPTLAVDPALIAQAEKRKQALAAIEEGHALLGDGKDKAKVEQAIVSYQKALSFEPNLARAERALGVAYAAKGDDENALKHYKRFVELDPAAPEAPQVKSIVEKYEQKAGKQK
ncbi:MAG: tetratricopeptide repeat protein [Myxococcota bacterium]